MEIKGTAPKSQNTDLRPVRTAVSPAGKLITQARRDVSADRGAALEGAPPVTPVITRGGTKAGAQPDDTVPFIDFLMVEGQQLSQQAPSTGAGVSTQMANAAFTANMDPGASGYQGNGAKGAAVNGRPVTGLVFDFKV